MQNWGDRSEIIRLELHDVSLAMNVFGKVLVYFIYSPLCGFF